MSTPPMQSPSLHLPSDQRHACKSSCQNNVNVKNRTWTSQEAQKPTVDEPDPVPSQLKLYASNARLHKSKTRPISRLHETVKD
jgi:hypothetical protein